MLQLGSQTELRTAIYRVLQSQDLMKFIRNTFTLAKRQYTIRIVLTFPSTTNTYPLLVN